ncbi:MAG TPA: hypothetical protein VHT28_12490 [Silvibacterium sp.]|nr:hypothetical protein [Silvibacterium sp.]
MANEPGSGFEDFGRKVDETLNKTVPRVEEELKKVIAYLNNEVVPSVRGNSSKALRVAADQLTRLAEHMDRYPTGRGKTGGDK